jgi:hypothetical protein
MANEELADAYNHKFKPETFYRHKLSHRIEYIPKSGDVMQNCWKETPLDKLNQEYASQLVPISDPERVESDLRADAKFMKAKRKESSE